MEGRESWPGTGGGADDVEEAAAQWAAGKASRDEELAVAAVGVAGAPPGAMGMSVRVAM